MNNQSKMKLLLLSAPVFCLAFLAILFLQSGLDKVINYKGNKDWFESHFAKSPLKNMVGLITLLITALETAAGIFSAAGIVFILLGEGTQVGLIGAQLSTLSIIALFFGQRLAQDYAGAATLTSYFIICVMTIYLLSF